MKTLLERIVEDLNETLFWNTKEYKRMFTIEKRYFVVHNPDVNALTESFQTTYRIYLNHHTAGCLVFETYILEDKQEESDDTWLILEEKVIKVLARHSVFGIGNLVDTMTKLHRR